MKRYMTQREKERRQEEISKREQVSQEIANRREKYNKTFEKGKRKLTQSDIAKAYPDGLYRNND
jgi:uncharacterized protein YceH (UPF0502 family)